MLPKSFSDPLSVAVDFENGIFDYSTVAESQQDFKTETKTEQNLSQSRIIIDDSDEESQRHKGTIRRYLYFGSSLVTLIP